MHKKTQSIMKRSLVAISFCAYSATSTAQWLGTVSTGANYSDNYSLQNGNYNNISQNQTTRTGSEVGGSINWQSINEQGGYSVSGRFLIDKDNNADLQNTNINTSASKIISLNNNWLSRYTLGLTQYRDESYTLNSFNGTFLEATFGYFANNQNGYDISFSYNSEDHNQDKNNTYQNKEYTVKGIYYADNDISIMGGLQRLQSIDSRRNTTSYLASINKINIKLNSFTVSVAGNLKIDAYDEAYTTSTITFLPSSLINQGRLNQSSTQNRTDTQMYLSSSLQKNMSKNLIFQLSSNAGNYNSVTGDQTFFNLYARLRWSIQ